MKESMKVLLSGVFLLSAVIALPVAQMVMDPQVRVVNDARLVFVHQKREAVTLPGVVGTTATTVYRNANGELRALTQLLNRMPVSYDLPANPQQANLFHRYF